MQKKSDKNYTKVLHKLLKTENKEKILKVARGKNKMCISSCNKCKLEII